METEKFVTFDQALAELQMATNELRSLVSRGKIVPEGDGLQINFRLSEVLDLKKSLKETAQPELPITGQKAGKGWAREEALITWRGAAPETGRVSLRIAQQDWDNMQFRLFFDARGTVREVGFLAGERAFLAETRSNPAKWHSFLIEMRLGSGRVVIDDREVFSGQLSLPSLALCAAGPTELSKTGQDTAIFRGLKLESLRD